MATNKSLMSSRFRIAKKFLKSELNCRTSILRHMYGIKKVTSHGIPDYMATSDWYDFTPRSIDTFACQARTWNNGDGGQCMRSQVKGCKLCTSHKLQKASSTGLVHGLVTGKIPSRKMAEFKRVRIFRSRMQHSARAFVAVRQREDRELHVPTKVTVEYVAHILLKATFPICVTRKNLRPHGELHIRAFCLGLLNSYNRSKLVLSSHSKIVPNLSKLLSMLGQKSIPDRRFQFTSIQVNKNFNSRMHVDKNNMGPSFGIAFGDYEGGFLWVYNPNGDVPMVVPAGGVIGAPTLQEGTILMGDLHDLKHKWVKFNGCLPHCVLPFTGTRVSLIFFKHKHAKAVDKATRNQLMKLGFPRP